MNKKAFFRIVSLAILISIFTIITCPLCGQRVCYAAGKDFSVSLSSPKWNNDILRYESVVIGNKTTNPIKTVSIYVDKGYMVSLPDSVKWHTDLGKDLGSGVKGYQTAICVLTDSTDNTASVANMLKDIKYKLESYNQNIDITIIVDGQDTQMPTVNGYTVTRGKDNHYYVFVDDPEVRHDWTTAYNKAKELKLMDMQGYLVTVTSADEDRLLDNITTKGAWAGAVRVPVDLDDSELNQDTVWTGFGLPPEATNSVWKWVCGPETGNTIKITGSYSDTHYKVLNPRKDTSDYSNWNRNSAEENKGNEPNDHGEEWGGGQGEFCMSVHYGNSGEAGQGILGWNDLPRAAEDNGDIKYIEGYFVEFNGLDLTKSVTTTVNYSVPYSHSWKYDTSTDENGNVDVDITCDEPTHEECEYNPESGTKPEIKVSIDAPDAKYSASPYSSASLKVTKDGTELTSTEYAEFSITPGAITYSGTDVDGNSYGPATTPPTYVGDYEARSVVNCNGTDLTAIQKFKITKADLRITLKDQTVKKDQDINKTLAGAVESVATLKGSDALESIVVTADTSTVGTSEIHYDNTVANPIVIKASTKDVTKNYEIVVVKGKLNITAKTPDASGTVSATELIYGQKLKESSLSGDVKDPDTTSSISGAYSWDSPNNESFPEVSDSNTTDYDVTFTPNNTTDYELVHKKLKVKVSPKDIADETVTRTLSLNIENIPEESLFDTQTGKTVVKDTDYTIGYVRDGLRIKVTINGIGNYKGKVEVYLDMPKWTGRIETRVVVDTSARDLQPMANAMSQENGGKILQEKVKNPSTTNETKAKNIVDKILTTGSSTDGDFKALISLLISDADATVSAEEKAAAQSLIGASPIAGQTVKIPSDAKIGKYFDISLDIERRIVSKLSDPETELINKKDAVIDISDATFPGKGFAETIRVTVPENLRPAKGYSRTYYIIRVHDDGVNPLKAEVLPVTRNSYNLTFSTDKFSKYAIAYTESKDAEKKSDVTDNNSSSGSSTTTNVSAPVVQATNPITAPTTVQTISPPTGDNRIVGVALTLVMTGIALLWFAFSNKREAKS